MHSSTYDWETFASCSKKFSPSVSFLPLPVHTLPLWSTEPFQSKRLSYIPHKQFHKILSIGTNLFPKCQLQRNNFLFGDTIHTDPRRPTGESPKARAALLDFIQQFFFSLFSGMDWYWQRIGLWTCWCCCCCGTVNRNQKSNKQFAFAGLMCQAGTGRWWLRWLVSVGGNCISWCQTRIDSIFFLRSVPIFIRQEFLPMAMIS